MLCTCIHDVLAANHYVGSKDRQASDYGDDWEYLGLYNGVAYPDADSGERWRIKMDVAAMCLLVVPLVMLCIRHLCLRNRPQINGSHGEYTMSDDVNMAFTGVADGIRSLTPGATKYSILSVRDSPLNGNNGSYTNSDDVKDYAPAAMTRGNAGPPRHRSVEKNLNTMSGRHGGGAKVDMTKDRPPLSTPSEPSDLGVILCEHALRDPSGLCRNRNCRFTHIGEKDREPTIWDEAVWDVGSGRYEVTVLSYHPDDPGLPAPKPRMDIPAAGHPEVSILPRGDASPAECAPRVVWCDHKRGIQHIGVLLPGEPYKVNSYPGIFFRSACLENGQVVPAVPVGTYFPNGAVDSGDGWVLLTPFSNASAVARPILQLRHTAPNYAHRISGRSVAVCIPWLRRVVHLHSSCKLDVSVGDAASAYMMRHYPVDRGWEAVLRDTAVIAEEALGTRMVGRSRRVLLPDEVPASGPPEVMALHHAGLLHPSGPKVDPLHDPIVSSYTLRPRATFFAFKGCVDTSAGEAFPPAAEQARAEGIPFCADGALTRSLPCFRTWGEPTRDPKGGQRFVEIRGGGQQFVRYKTNTLDMYAGLQRTLGAREDEDAMERAEARLWSLIEWSRPDRPNGRVGNPNVVLDECLDRFQPGCMLPRVSISSGVLDAKSALQWPSENPCSPTYVWRRWRCGPRQLERECGAAEYGFHHALGVVGSVVGRSTLQRLLDGVATCRHSFGVRLNMLKWSTEQWVLGSALNLDPHDMPLHRWREFVAALPREKRRLRMAYVAGQKIHTSDDYMMMRATLKLKPNEPAKYGKPTRITADLKAGSEYAALLPPMVKACVDGYHTWQVGGLVVHLFVALKPSKSEVADLMRAVLTAAGKRDTLCAVVHSDDKLVGVNIGGHQAVFNSDISGCDRSNRSFIHSALWALYAKFSPDLATGLINQCRAPAEVFNPAAMDESFRVYPDGKGNVVQYSGAVNTTIVNTLASSGLVGAIAAELWDRRSEIQVAEDIPNMAAEAAMRCGYNITVTDCRRPDGSINPSRMEFLKHAYVEATHQVYLEPAAIIRSFGRMHGGITSNRLGWSEEERAYRMRDPGLMLHRIGSMVVRGLVHEPESTVLRAFRERYNDATAPLDVGELGYCQQLVDAVGRTEHSAQDAGEAIGIPVGSVSPPSCEAVDAAMCERYGITMDDLDELARKIVTQPPGTSLSDYAVTRMNYVSYGVAPCARGECDRIGGFYEGRVEITGQGQFAG